MGNSKSVPRTPRRTKVFLSYRRDGGSEIASLISEQLSKKEKWEVFLDIHTLEAGQFGPALLQHVKESKHFILILTPGSLDRCIEDQKNGVCEDWVHKEISAALENELNIILVIHSDFQWPPAEDLPQDMRNISLYNGVPWSHYFQKTVVDVIERFMRGAKCQKEIDRKRAIEQILMHHMQHNHMNMMGPPHWR